MNNIRNTFIHTDSKGNFKPILSRTEGILVDARDRSWYQTSVPCQTACPAGTDIPGYLQSIREGDYAAAYRMNLRDNVFPAVLGRICTRPCEPACRHGREALGESVAICFAKRSAADFKMNHIPVTLPPLFGATQKKIAVIGAGPAGLSVARELSLMGHQVCMYEKHSRPGGMMIQGIPAFRLPREIVSIEIEQVLSQGIELRCGIEIGIDVTLGELSADNDAVVVTTGAHLPRRPDLTGNTLDGVRHGFDFIRGVNMETPSEVGASVTVIGGGFTAVDCAQAAHYLGAEHVELVYRRSREQMRCTETEIARIEDEGVDLILNTTPAGFVGQQRISEIELKATDRDTAAWRKKTDTVLLATGQERAFESMDPILGKILEHHWLKSDTPGHRVENTNLFGCGDARWGAQTIIDAIGDAKKCARGIDRFLMGENRFQENIQLATVDSTGRQRSCNDIPRHQSNTLDTENRGLHNEIDEGLSMTASQEEAWRCYMCNQKVEIDTSKCVSCGLCLMVMPVDGCIVQLKKEEDGEGNISHNAINDFESYDALAVDQDRCIRCNACRESCPVDCISLQTATPVVQLKQSHTIGPKAVHP